MRDVLVRVRDVVTGRWFVKGAFFAFFVFSVVQLFRFAAWARGTGPYVLAAGGAGGHPADRALHELLRAGCSGGGWDTLLPAGLVIILGGARGVAAVQARLLRLDLPGRHGLGGASRRSAAGFSAATPCCPSGSTSPAARSATCLRPPSWGSCCSSWCRSPRRVAFRELPYMWVADLKILGMMLDPSTSSWSCSSACVSMLFGPLWCRYLCPLGGLYSAVGIASPCTVERDAETCIHCTQVHEGRATRSWTSEKVERVCGARVRRVHGLREGLPGRRLPRGQGVRLACASRRGCGRCCRGAVARDLGRREGDGQLGLDAFPTRYSGRSSTPVCSSSGPRGFFDGAVARCRIAVDPARCSLRYVCTQSCVHTSRRGTARLSERGLLHMVDATIGSRRNRRSARRVRRAPRRR